MSKKQKVKVTAIVPTEVAEETRKQGGLVLHTAETMIVSSASEEQSAYAVLQNINAAVKAMEKKRTGITGPINASLREVNGMFKTFAAPFKRAERLIREKIIIFRRAEEEKAELERLKREEEAEKERLRREKIQASHAAKGHKTTELEKIEVEEVEVKTASETVTVKRWVWEVVDIKKVPDEFFMLDQVAVNKAVKGGAREITGLRIYQDERVRL